MVCLSAWVKKDFVSLCAQVKVFKKGLLSKYAINMVNVTETEFDKVVKVATKLERLYTKELSESHIDAISPEITAPIKTATQPKTSSNKCHEITFSLRDFPLLIFHAA